MKRLFPIKLMLFFFLLQASLPQACRRSIGLRLPKETAGGMVTRCKVLIWFSRKLSPFSDIIAACTFTRCVEIRTYLTRNFDKLLLASFLMSRCNCLTSDYINRHSERLLLCASFRFCKVRLAVQGGARCCLDCRPCRETHDLNSLKKVLSASL